MKKTQNLHEYIRDFKSAEKLAVAKYLINHKAPAGEHEDISEMNLNHKIEDIKYRVHEEYCYKLFELIESKNPLCSRSDAQRIANILLEDLSFSKWEFLKSCINGDIDR